MAAAFVSTTRSPTVLIIRRLESIWVTGGPVTIVTPIAEDAIRTGIPIVIVTTAVVEDGMIEIETGTPMDATAATGVTDAAQHPVVAVEDTRPTTGVVGATPEARLGEAVLPEVLHEIMRLRLQLLLRLLRPVQMCLGGECLRHREWAKIKMR
jgi:hypothetical protein